jgi:hypothetical protein
MSFSTIYEENTLALLHHETYGALAIHWQRIFYSVKIKIYWKKDGFYRGFGQFEEINVFSRGS